MGLYNGKRPVAQLRGCHDLHTADGESVHKRTVKADVLYSTQTAIRLNRGHYIKGSNPLSKHAFIESMNTTKVYRRLIGCVLRPIDSEVI